MFSAFLELTGLNKLWGYVVAGASVVLLLVLGYFKARQDGKSSVVADINAERAKENAKVVTIQANINQLNDADIHSRLQQFSRD